MKNKTKHETSRINCRGCERIIQLKESNSNKETNPVKMVSEHPNDVSSHELPREIKLKLE